MPLAELRASDLQLAKRPRSVAGRTSRALRRVVLGGCLVLAGVSLAAPAALAGPADPVDLGTSAPYAVLSGASVGNVVSADGAPHTTIYGGLAVKPSAAPLGFPPGVVTGAFDVGNPAASQAFADAQAAYTEIAARQGGTLIPGALAGATITPGLYTIAGAASNTTSVTLDAGGNQNAYFVFQVGGALSFAASSHVVLTGGARASHVFWQVNGAGALGATATFAGTMIAHDAGAAGNSTVVNGRIFALGGALTLDNNNIYAAPPVVLINGGATAYTTTTTPTISGTTDQVAPTVVTVVIAGQTYSVTPSAGTWSVAAPLLANGVYTVTASATDGAANTTTATQQLTVDTVLPIVTIGDGNSLTTNSRRPMIAGTTDVDPGSIVHVGVDGTPLTALVQSDGSWNITPAALSDGDHHVTASVFDPAGNQGTDSETITIDTTPPALTVTGGANALSNDPTPTLSGNASVTPGTSVTITLADQTLHASVQGNGSFSVDSAVLVDGPHRVIFDVFDAAGNETLFTQTLTIDTVSPLVTITGGSSSSTTNTDPTITGTTDAASGTTVTVTIAGQTMTALVQSNGSWNATPDPIGFGTFGVVASVPDPAGNVGSATQTLTVASAQGPPPPPTVTLTGGADRATTNPEPTISGTTSATPGTTVTVTIGGQTMTALVQANGTWNVTPAPIGVGTWQVTVTVPNPGGTVGSAQQTITVSDPPPPTTGPAGATGPTGATGPAGSTGPAGANGAPGPAGANGGTGVNGSTGANGVDGATGANGVDGATGSTGSTGAPGSVVLTQTTVAPDGSQKLSGQTLTIGTKVTAPASGNLTVTTSGSVKIDGVSKTIALTTTRLTLAAGTSATIKSTPTGTSKAAKAAIARFKAAIRAGKNVTATVTLKLVAADGHTRTVQRLVKLT